MIRVYFIFELTKLYYSMKQEHLKRLSLRLLICTAFLMTASIIHSCRKDSRLISQLLTDSVSLAKSWYESTYPAATSSGSGSLTTLSANTTPITQFDYSQHIKPNWASYTTYRRFNRAVIEMPMNPSNSFLASLKNKTTGNLLYTKENSKTSFIILNDGKSYEAFVMVILADASYIGGDPTRLAKNTYRKRDANFTGMVLYFTPKGALVTGFAYKNGIPLAPATSQASAAASLKTQSLKTLSPCDVSDNVQKQTNSAKQLSDLYNCTDWYLETYLNGALIGEQYLYTTCSLICADGGGGASPAPPCTAPDTTGSGSTPPNQNSVSALKVNDVGGVDDGGMGDPTVCTNSSIIEENDFTESIPGISLFDVRITVEMTVTDGVITYVFNPTGVVLPSQVITSSGVVIKATVFNFHFVTYPVLPSPVVVVNVGYSVNYQYSDGTPSVHLDLVSREVLTGY